MVVMGMIIGAICYYFQASGLWPVIHTVPVWKMLVVMLIGFTLIPVPESLDIRGWSEMHPLDGPGWSLFYEYVANILYGVIVRKFSKTALWILVTIAACALIHLTVTDKNGDVIGGWSLHPEQILIGSTRLMYPFFAGLLLSRSAKMTYVKNAFLWCTLLILVFLAMPRIGGSEHLWMNGLYESLTIIFIFPLIVYLGASGEVKNRYGSRICKFLGEISYPIYITHYPLIYIYTAWVVDNKVPFGKALPVGLVVVLSAIAIAYACLKLYDEPVRRWLKGKVLMGA